MGMTVENVSFRVLLEFYGVPELLSLRVLSFFTVKSGNFAKFWGMDSLHSELQGSYD